MFTVKRILYMQHAGVMGGSVKSLRGLLLRLDRKRFEPQVCIVRPSPEVLAYYRDAGIETFSTDRIWPLAHASGSWAGLGRPVDTFCLLQGLLRWRRTVAETKAIVASRAPDLVHLNSSILLPCARTLRAMGQKFVWHVRESPQPRYMGLRLGYFRQALATFPDERVFLSLADRSGWMGGQRVGEVIPNSAEDLPTPTDAIRISARRRLDLADDTICILYLGGFIEIKGIYPLLESVRQLKGTELRFVFLMPGTNRVPGRSLISRIGRLGLWVLAGGTDQSRALKFIARNGLEAMLHRLPFTPEVSELLAACDMLVFPATVPHFAMPVVEAGAAGRAVIASEYPGMNEIVLSGKTGLLVPCNDSDRLTQAILQLGRNKTERVALGQAGRERCCSLFTYEQEAGAFMQLYERLLSGPCSAGV